MSRMVYHIYPCRNARGGGEGDQHEKGNEQLAMRQDGVNRDCESAAGRVRKTLIIADGGDDGVVVGAILNRPAFFPKKQFHHRD